MRRWLTHDLSIFFPPVETQDKPSTQEESATEQETSTEPSEMLSQLPDAPLEDPRDTEDTEQPSPKKQKIDEADDDDDFVVVEKEDAVEDKPKAEL
jgi:hypothetical protein